MYRVYQKQAASALWFSHRFIFLSLQCPNIKNAMAVFAGTMRTRRLETCYMLMMQSVDDAFYVNTEIRLPVNCLAYKNATYFTH